MCMKPINLKEKQAEKKILQMLVELQASMEVLEEKVDELNKKLDER
jgi:hypothetical protein